MPSFSTTLEQAIHAALALANARRHEFATLEHLLLALIDDEEATLKRLRRRGSSIALEAANPAYETRVFPEDKVKVQGRLVGLIRTY